MEQQSTQSQLLIGGKRKRREIWQRNKAECRKGKKEDIKVERAERKKSSCKEKDEKRSKRRKKKEQREEGEYSRLVFQLITTEDPGAAIRHIFFTNDFFFITNIN